MSMRIRKSTILPLFASLLLISVTALASSGRIPTEYGRCQNLLKSIHARVEEMTKEHGKFPPPRLTYASDTGEIPMSFLVEQSLETELEKIRLLQPSCRYALAPWAIPASGRAAGSPYDIYCHKHGFDKFTHTEGRLETVTADSIRKHFISHCTKHGISLGPWQSILDNFNPDELGFGRLNPLQRFFYNAVLQFGSSAFLVAQIFIALCGTLLFLRKNGVWRLNMFASITAGAALWVGVQTIFLVCSLAPAVQATQINSLHSLRLLFASQEIGAFPLFFFFFTMIFFFRRHGYPSGPVILLTFAMVPGVLFTNILTALIGLWAFRSIVRSAANVPETPAMSK